jgi:hypothetical protein
LGSAPFLDFERAGQSEVGDTNQAFPVDQYVLRFEVLVDDALAMGGGQPLANLTQDAGRGLLRKFSRGPDEIGQGLAFDVLHGDELDSLDLAQVIQADHVLLGDRPAQEGFLFELADEVVISGMFRLDHLQGHVDIKFAVMGFVNPAHAAPADLLDNDVAAAEALTRGKGQGIPLWPRRGGGLGQGFLDCAPDIFAAARTVVVIKRIGVGALRTDLEPGRFIHYP